MKKEEKEALERYEIILLKIQESKSPKKEIYKSFVAELVKKCIEYTLIITREKRFTETQRSRLEPEIYQEKLIEIDTKRRLAHNALLSQLKIVNRNLFSDKLLEKIPPGGIYSFPSETLQNRYIIGTWAAYFVSALAQKAKDL